MVTATLRKNLGPPVPQQNDDSYLQEDQEPQRGHLVRACALLRQLKPVILKQQPHSLKSLAAKQIRKTWILCYFMLWLPQRKRVGESSKRPSDHRKCYNQCKSECTGSGRTFQHLWYGRTFQHLWQQLWVRVKSWVTFLCNI